MHGDNALGSIRLYVRLFVCLSELSCFNCLTFDLDFRHRGSTFPSATKSNKSHYQSKVFGNVYVISGHMLIIARMRSIGF